MNTYILNRFRSTFACLLRRQAGVPTIIIELFHKMFSVVQKNSIQDKNFILIIIINSPHSENSILRHIFLATAILVHPLPAIPFKSSVQRASTENFQNGANAADSKARIFRNQIRDEPPWSGLHTGWAVPVQQAQQPAEAVHGQGILGVQPVPALLPRLHLHH